MANKIQVKRMLWKVSSCVCPVYVRQHPLIEYADMTTVTTVKSVDLRQCIPWHPFVVFMKLYHAWTTHRSGSTELRRFRDRHIERMLKVFAARSDRPGYTGFRDMTMHDLNAMTRVICDSWDEIGMYVSTEFDGMPKEWSVGDYVQAWGRYLAVNMSFDYDQNPEWLPHIEQDMPGALARFISEWHDYEPLKIPSEHSNIVVMPNDYDTNDKMLGTRKYHNVSAFAEVLYTLPFVADESIIRGLVQLTELERREDIDDITVNNDNSVSIRMPLKLCDGFPVADGLRMEALRHQATTVDAIYKTMTDLVASVEQVREGTSHNVDNIH